MKIEYLDFKSKTWGIIPLPDMPDHFHTGYEKDWNGSNRWDLVRSIGTPHANMQIGRNVVIDGALRINSYGRGRSAANFSETFIERPEVSYTLSMDGASDLFSLIQSGAFAISDGAIMGRWTFAKQGQNIFLRPLGESNV